MAKLTELPLEILEHIAEDLPRQWLWAMTFTNQKLHRYLNPLLYRFVYFPLSRYGWWHHLDHVRDCMSCLRQDSQRRKMRVYQPTLIYDPYNFLRTMEESSTLCALVIAGCFDANHNEVLKDTIIRTLNQLEPVAQFLHLSPGSAGQGITNFGPPSGLHYPSLRMKYGDLADEGVGPVMDELVTREKMYLIFSMTTLRGLHLKDVRSWRLFSGDTADKTKQKSSPIISLLFSGSNVLDKDLEEVLIWPKTLISFQHEIEAHGDEQGVLSPGKYVDALLPQASSLEILRIRLDNIELWTTYDGSTIGSLCDFIKLKRLTLPLEFIIKKDLHGEEDFTPKIYTILPRNLEHLEIDMGRDFAWYDYKPQGFTHAPIATNVATRFFRNVQEIAEHKPARYPNFMSLALYKRIKTAMDNVHMCFNFGDLGGDSHHTIVALYRAKIFLIETEARVFEKIADPGRKYGHEW